MVKNELDEKVLKLAINVVTPKIDEMAIGTLRKLIKKAKSPSEELCYMDAINEFLLEFNNFRDENA